MSALDSQAGPATTHELFVARNARRDSFCAAIRGHFLELADPDAGHTLAPTPDDLLIASIASDFAWSAQRFLRDRRLPDDVSVSGTWRTHDDSPGLADIDLAVTVSNDAEAANKELATALKKCFAARSLNAPVRIRIRSA
jgi:uncharacterized OsmC-like protein